MPIKKDQPTTQEKTAASKLQSPSKLGKESAVPKARSLKEAALDSASKEFVKSSQLFENQDDEASMPFMVLNASRIPSKLSPGSFQVAFTIQLVGETERYTLTLADDSNRSEFVKYFSTESIPLGPVQLIKLPVSQKGHHPYLSIQDADVPF